MKSKKKRINSDALLRRNAGGVRKPNPFETVVMKSKHAVLNRGPQSKQPGAIRRQAIESRKQTLGKEFAVLHKSNRFTDARVGGKQTQHQSKAVQRKEMYNLNLTHRGQTLAELDNLDDVVDDDNDDDEDGMLHDDFTRATHFGGGSDDEGGKAGRSRKSVIEEMIAEAKRVKAEKQRDNDMVFEKSVELDKNLRQLMSHVKGHIRSDSERTKPDDYDRTMREMIFERRGAPAEKLKSEQLARKEMLRRERLEKERLERMKDAENDRGKDKNRKHLSADALDDGYLLNGDDDKNGAMSDEEIGHDIEAYNPRNVSQEGAGKSSTAQEDNGEENSENDDDDDETDDEESGSDADSLSDLKNVAPSSDEEDEDEETEPEKEIEPEKPIVPMVPIPRNIEIPKQYEDFAHLLQSYPVEQQALVVEKIVQKANENNHYARAQRPVLFIYIIQHLVDRFTVTGLASVEKDFKALHLLMPFLYDLANRDPSGTSGMFHDVLEEKYRDFEQHRHRHPPLSTLIILKMLPLLFSASDMRHSIVSPGLVFISELLTRCPVRNRNQIARGLLLVTTVLECVEQSKRFLPAVLSFLAGVVNLALPPDSAHVSTKCVPPFKATASSLLPVQENDGAVKSPSEGLKLIAEDLIRSEMTESFKVRAVATTIMMISTISTQLADCPAIQTIAKFFLDKLRTLETISYPAKVKALLKKTQSKLTKLADRPVTYLVAPQQKPKPLRLLEPEIFPVYDDVRRRPKTELSLRDQRKRLIQKVKKEKRSAARELRLDNEYISTLQHKRRMAQDRERKEKVKRIFNDATTQQGELKSLDRKAKYRN